VQYLVQPLVVSSGWEDRPHRFGKPVRSFVGEQEWQGTRDIAAYLSVPAAVQFQAEHDWPRVRAQCHELLREARRQVEALRESRNPASGRNLVSMACPDSPEWYAQMASFPLSPCDAAALQRRLYDEYRVEVPIIEWNGQQFVRVSIQGYNILGDVETLVGALEVLLPQMAIASP
jgi:isopenicillin-N epimerase